MKLTPKDWPRLSVSLAYEDAAKAIDWLVKAFDFEVRLKVEGDQRRIEHSELTYGEGLIMIGSPRADRTWYKSPKLTGACTQATALFVDDVDAHCQKARANGAVIATEPKTSDYGEGYWVDRSYEAVDLEGHHWYFMQRLQDKTKKP